MQKFNKGAQNTTANKGNGNTNVVTPTTSTPKPQTLGTAADVAAQLTADAIANGAVIPVTPVVPVAPVVAKPKVKVKLTDIILAVITNTTLLTPEVKTALTAEITAKLVKVTTTKPSVKSYVYDLLVEAGANGITKDAIVTKFMGKTPAPSTAELIGFITQLNFFVQPSFYKREGWAMFVKEGGYYGITAPKTTAPVK